MPSSTSLLRLVILSLLAAMTAVHAQLNVELTFNNNNLDLGNTGTFAISGSTTSSSGRSSFFVTSEPSTSVASQLIDPGELQFDVVSLDSTPNLLYNGVVQTNSMIGTPFLNFFKDMFGASNAFRIAGPITDTPGIGLDFQIGDGVSDTLTGSFLISISSGLGGLTVADLNGETFGRSINFEQNIRLNSNVIPEPSTYALMIGIACLGLVAWKRKRSSNT